MLPAPPYPVKKGLTNARYTCIVNYVLPSHTTHWTPRCGFPSATVRRNKSSTTRYGIRITMHLHALSALTMPINSLTLTNVGPFNDIRFIFDRQVNVFTGANNTGKSSVLWALGDIAVYPFNFPEKLIRKDGTPQFRCSVQGFEGEYNGQLPVVIVTSEEHPETRNSYWTQERTDTHIAVLEKIGYSKFIPTLRRSTDFRSEGPRPQYQASFDDVTSPRTFDSTSSRSRRGTRYRRRSTRHESQGRRELLRRQSLVSDDASFVSDEDVIEN